MIHTLTPHLNISHLSASDTASMAYLETEYGAVQGKLTRPHMLLIITIRPMETIEKNNNDDFIYQSECQTKPPSKSFRLDPPQKINK